MMKVYALALAASAAAAPFAGDYESNDYPAPVCLLYLNYTASPN
jgi:hypothetical protein